MPTRRRPRLSPPRPLHQVYVPSHPLAAHWLAVARNKASPSPVFRSAIAELGRILVYEAVDGWLPTVSGEVDTPCGVADCTFVDPGQPVKVVPILRAGLVLLEQVGGEGRGRAGTRARAALAPTPARHHLPPSRPSPCSPPRKLITWATRGTRRRSWQPLI